MKILITLLFLTTIVVGSCLQASSQTDYSNKNSLANRRKTWSKPTQRYLIDVVLEDKQSGILLVDEKQGYGYYAAWETKERHINIFRVYYPTANEHYTLAYIGDIAAFKGDTLEIKVDVHKDYSKDWTDYELANHLSQAETTTAPNDPERKRFLTGIITEVLNIKPPL